MSQLRKLNELLAGGGSVTRDDGYRHGIRNFSARISEYEKANGKLSREAVRDNQGQFMFAYTKASA